MKTALIGLKFNDSVSEEDVETAISNFYGINNSLIKGMTYLEFKDPDTLGRVYEFLKKDDDTFVNRSGGGQ